MIETCVTHNNQQQGTPLRSGNLWFAAQTYHKLPPLHGAPVLGVRLHNQRIYNTVARCFQDCACQCGQTDNEFDLIAASELANPISLQSIARMNIGWFSDRNICDHHINEWGLDHKEGVYILWHKSDYCAEHERFHMRALYVGKGNIGIRLRTHWENKDFSDQLLIYFTYVEMQNRLSKYVEQLLLDVYDFPLNKSENTGQKILCEHFTQNEVD
ncbi:hypothetical protein PVT67_14500 [Gallaecimonas kandeliae]|uniref:hypothetical protein n=1 Tax=Gallaecimonas kandeliae TaxID=3029055 RepID=UPI002648EE5E|nr:hypothetical protein [Gallaecimonas kandeliae]WKE64864.1 hypothetical protein PVT67_14500 [Gallaecimonas kandeliae]